MLIDARADPDFPLPPINPRRNMLNVVMLEVIIMSFYFRSVN